LRGREQQRYGTAKPRRIVEMYYVSNETGKSTKEPKTTTPTENQQQWE